MAAPSTSGQEYVQRAQSMDWDAVKSLWESVKAGDTPEWTAGKALEHLIVRGFEFSELPVEYPYDVPPGGKPIEQIDGLVRVNELVFLIECKDKETSDVEVIAKVRHQLARRPPTTLANVFVAGTFTLPALILADLTVPHQVLLWTRDDIEAAVNLADFKSPLLDKYYHLCQFGLLDHSPHYKELATANG